MNQPQQPGLTLTKKDVSRLEKAARKSQRRRRTTSQEGGILARLAEQRQHNRSRPGPRGWNRQAGDRLGGWRPRSRSKGPPIRSAASTPSRLERGCR